MKTPEIKELHFNTSTCRITVVIEARDTIYVDEKGFPKLVNGKLLLDAIKSALNENEAKHNNPGEKQMLEELAATRYVKPAGDNNHSADSSKVIDLKDAMRTIQDDYEFNNGLQK